MKTRLLPDPAGRRCPDCLMEIGESIPLDIDGFCHGCGRSFGKAEEQKITTPQEER